MGEAEQEERGGALYREGDSRVKGAARPIRWLQLITVCLLIVRRPQAELLRREGGEFDLITAHPKGDLGNVERGEREREKWRGGLQQGALSQSSLLLFIRKRCPLVYLEAH